MWNIFQYGECWLLERKTTDGFRCYQRIPKKMTLIPVKKTPSFILYLCGKVSMPELILILSKLNFIESCLSVIVSIIHNTVIHLFRGYIFINSETNIWAKSYTPKLWNTSVGLKVDCSHVASSLCHSLVNLIVIFHYSALFSIKYTFSLWNFHVNIVMILI